MGISESQITVTTEHYRHIVATANNWNETENTTASNEEDRVIKRYVILLTLTMSIVGVTGNIMVLLAVKVVSGLRNDMNKMLCSLATADFLVCALVMPCSATQLATGNWKLGKITCSIFIFLDVCLCTASIMHICSISVDRCIGVAFPLANRTCYRKSLILVMKLVIVWGYSIGTALPVFTSVNEALDDKYYMEGRCILGIQEFQIYGSLFAFYIPVTVMTIAHITTTRILKTQHLRHKNNYSLRRAQGFRVTKICRPKQGSGSFQTNSDLRTINGEKDADENGVQESSQQSFSNTYTKNYSTVNPSRYQIDIVKKRQMYIGQRLSRSDSEKYVLAIKYQHTYQPTLNVQQKKIEHLPGLKQFHKRASKLIDFKMWTKQSAQNGVVSREQKAAKVLMIVFMVFLVCWSPFFILNLISGICEEKDGCQIPVALMDVAVWLGYCSSIINPIIYTIINKDFQQAFR
ncbi:D(2) dopamine receptor-like [Watersipora subatra]|uniref:D(2) dopamine receptor-like n=1 Tax=Watersipora subatra TaxID=2589382 RepID=UPI00355B4B1B